MSPELVTNLAQLGPALGSVVVIGVICWKLLEMFAKHGDALGTVSENMHAHTNALNIIARNVEANTKATEKMAALIEDAPSLRSRAKVTEVPGREDA